MKRKAVTARCAAANDDDFEDVFGAPEATEKKAKTGGAVRPEDGQGAVAGAGARRAPPAKKEKEFAWMDSDDEDEDEAGQVRGSQGAERGSEVKDGSGAQRGGDDDDEASNDCSAPVLDAAERFGQLVRLVPSVQARLSKSEMDVTDIAATYRAMGRLKFFDGDLLDSLNRALCKLLRGGKGTDTLACDAVECLATLNAYDRSVYSTIAQFFRPRILVLEPNVRNMLLQCFQHVQHTTEKDFVQMLEVTPLSPVHPGFKKIRCRHDAQGSCVLGASCTFSHDPRALFTLEIGTGIPRPSQVMLTQCQLLQGRGAYTNAPSYAPG